MIGSQIIIMIDVDDDTTGVGVSVNGVGEDMISVGCRCDWCG